MGKTFGSLSKVFQKDNNRSARKKGIFGGLFSKKLEITPEIQEILDLVEAGGEKVILVSGAAGTGKSVLIDILRDKTKKNIVVVAPTGIAALNVSGQTIHSFFRLAPRPQPDPQRIKGLNGLAIKAMNVLVIDEISMVRADLMDAISQTIKLNIDDQSTPFCGKTVVLIGDLHQLPPVVASFEERQLFSEQYSSPYFISANCLRDVEPIPKQLTKTFRQKDQEFINLLNDIRVGRNLQSAVEQLNEHCYRPSTDSASLLTLTTINRKADQINDTNIKAIASPQRTYEASLDGHWGKGDTNLPAPKTLNLKVGAQVMFVKNGVDWVNGSLGQISKLGTSEVQVRLLGQTDNRVVTVRRENWQRLKYTYDTRLHRVETEVVGQYTQLPFRLAWAVTIHKAQGLTLDSVTIDLDQGTFEHGHAYVALSRCKTIGGISLSRPLRVDDIKIDKRISEFHQALGI